MAEVVIYIKPGCPYCEAAKEHYQGRGIKYKEIDVIGNPQAQKKLLELSEGKRIVPVIVDQGRVRIGWDGG